MSFTTEIKNEICMTSLTKSEKIAELSGFVRNNHILKDNKIQLVSENPKVARRIYTLLKDIYDVNVNITHQDSVIFNKRKYYIVEINNKIDLILKDLSVYENNKYLDEVKRYLIDSLEEQRSYIRGCFLATGSINDPKTSRYHLEMLLDNKKEADNIVEILKNFYLPSKVLSREKGYMLYMKEAEKISDFLRIINANNAVLYFEDIRIYRDHKNMTNRLNNCEQANVDKIISSCNKQLDDIKTIEEKLGIDLVDKKLVEVMTYRKKYKEVSLTELSNIISLETDKKITKSGLSHRFKKISEIASKLKE